MFCCAKVRSEALISLMTQSGKQMAVKFALVNLNEEPRTVIAKIYEATGALNDSKQLELENYVKTCLKSQYDSQAVILTPMEVNEITHHPITNKSCIATKHGLISSSDGVRVAAEEGILVTNKKQSAVDIVIAPWQLNINVDLGQIGEMLSRVLGDENVNVLLIILTMWHGNIYMHGRMYQLIGGNWLVNVKSDPNCGKTLIVKLCLRMMGMSGNGLLYKEVTDAAIYHMSRTVCV